MSGPDRERSLVIAEKVTMLLGAVGVGGAALLSLLAVWVSASGDASCATSSAHDRCIAGDVSGGIATAAAAFVAVLVGVLLAQRRVRAGDPRGWTRAAYGILGILAAPLVGLLVRAVVAWGA